MRVNRRVETMFGNSRKELIDSRSRFCCRNGSGNGTCGSKTFDRLSLVSAKWVQEELEMRVLGWLYCCRSTRKC